MLDEYMKLRFGSASKDLEKYFWQIENTVPKANRLPNTIIEDKNVLNSEMKNLKVCSISLAGAREKAGNDKRILLLLDKLALSLQYTTLDLQIRIISSSISDDQLDKTGENIKKLGEVYNEMKNLFNSNLDKGIFIKRYHYYN